MVFYYAFTDKTGAFTLDNVTRLTDYTSTFLRSLWFGIVATIICLLIAYPLAYILSRMKLRAQSTMVMLVMIPMWMNFLLRTYAWMTLPHDQHLGCGHIGNGLQFPAIYDSADLFRHDKA